MIYTERPTSEKDKKKSRRENLLSVIVCLLILPTAIIGCSIATGVIMTATDAVKQGPETKAEEISNMTSTSTPDELPTYGTTYDSLEVVFDMSVMNPEGAGYTGTVVFKSPISDELIYTEVDTLTKETVLYSIVDAKTGKELPSQDQKLRFKEIEEWASSQ